MCGWPECHFDTGMHAFSVETLSLMFHARRCDYILLDTGLTRCTSGGSLSTRGSIGRDFSDAIVPRSRVSGILALRLHRHPVLRICGGLRLLYSIIANCKVLVNSVIFKLLVSTGIMTRRLLGWRTPRKPMCWPREKMMSTKVEHEASSHQGSRGWWLPSAL